MNPSTTFLRLALAVGMLCPVMLLGACSTMTYDPAQSAVTASADTTPKLARRPGR